MTGGGEPGSCDDENVHAKAIEPHGVLGIGVAVFLFVFVVARDEIFPIFGERVRHLLEPRRDAFAVSGELVDERLHRFAHRGARRDEERAALRVFVALARLPHERRALLDLAREAMLGLLERFLRRLVERLELLRAERLAVQNRERLHAALHRAHAEAERLRGGFEARQHFAIFCVELAREVELRFTHRLEIAERRHLLTEIIEARGHCVRQFFGDTGGEHERARRLRMLEVVHVDEIRRRLRFARARELLGVSKHVVFDADLGPRRDEHMKARLARSETELERAARNGSDEIEETAARRGDFGQRVRARPYRRELGGNAQRTVKPLAKLGRRCDPLHQRRCAVPIHLQSES